MHCAVDIAVDNFVDNMMCRSRLRVRANVQLLLFDDRGQLSIVGRGDVSRETDELKLYGVRECSKCSGLGCFWVLFLALFTPYLVSWV